MRMTGPTSDRGVTSTLFVLFLSALLGLAALVIDIGNAWQERRQLVTATDAASLAAVQDYVHGDPGCTLSAPGSVTANNSIATMTSCVHVPPTAGSPGHVTVEAEATVDFFFAGVFGINSKTVASSTTANYDTAGNVNGGLRPFGLCIDYLSDLTPTMTPGNLEVYRIYYGRLGQVTHCNGLGAIAGEWGTLDFDGGANPLGDIRDWTHNGYDGTVSVGDWIEGNPGSFSPALSGELQYLIDNVDHFTLPIIGDYNVLPGGNAEFQIASFVSVRLHDFKTTGSNDSRYVDLEFLNNIVQGGGGGPGPGLGAYVIGICAVDGVNPAASCA